MNQNTQSINSLKLEKTEDCMTAHSGLLLFEKALSAYGIKDALIEHLPKPKSNRGKDPITYIYPTLLSMAGGGRTLEDIQKVLSDKVLRKMLNTTLFDSSTLCKWFRNHGEKMSFVINNINMQHVTKALEETNFTSFTADVDAMMIESNKKTAKKTYKGFHGYNTMLGFFAETAHCAYQSFRDGNVSPASGVLEALKGMRSCCPKGTDIGRFRSDSAGWTKDIIGYCEDTNIQYTITADMNVAVKRAISTIKESDWTTILDDTGASTDREVAETTYAFGGKGQIGHRLIVQRPTNSQLELFPGKHGHYAISSNMDGDPAHIIAFHNKRGQAENHNKELKYSLNLSYLPSNDFYSNRLWFALAVLVYNIFQTLKCNVLPSSWKKKKIATIRWQLIQISGKLVFHARQWTLKLASISQDIFDTLIEMRLKLCLP